MLDDTNTALTTDYDREFGATQGVDPTWDAGVNLKLVPPAPNKPDTLPDTGQAAGGLGLALVLLLLTVGGAELARRRVS